MVEYQDPNEIEKYELRVTADPNDGDDVTVINRITEQQWQMIKPLCESISKMNTILAIDRAAKRDDPDNYELKYNWNQSNYDAINDDDGRGYLKPRELYPHITEEQFDWFNELTPWCGDYGFHTIVSIELCDIPVIQYIV